jgi:hypothetical protein
MFRPYKTATEALFGSESLDESLRILSDALYLKVTDPSIEIEGKIGKFITNGTDQPYFIPQIRSETILQEHKEYRFQSTLTLQAFDNLNRALNDRFKALYENSDYNGPKIHFSKVKEIDRFYKYKYGKESVRVSLDPITLEKKRAIVKNKLQHLDFLCPQNIYDYRISISEERQVPIPNEDEYIPLRERHKDRLSYKFDIWQIDITVVRERKIIRGEPEELQHATYEVEMECSSEAILKERQLLIEKAPNRFTEYAKTFLANMRTLAKYSGANTQVQSKLPPQVNEKPPHDLKRKVDEDDDSTTNKKRKL